MNASSNVLPMGEVLATSVSYIEAYGLQRARSIALDAGEPPEVIRDLERRCRQWRRIGSWR